MTGRRTNSTSFRDSDSIDAGRGSNAVYRIGLEGRGETRILGAIPHGAGYLSSSDIDCHAATGSLVIASHRARSQRLSS